MTNSKILPLLIFDLDGTLIDSAEDIYNSLNVMLKKYDRKPVTKSVLVSHIGDGLAKLVNDFFPEFHIESEENEKRVNEFLKLYEDNLIEHTVLYPGVYDFLKNYKGPKALVTNKNIEPTERIFQHFKLDKLQWVSVIGGDSLSQRKPSALPLKHVMALANYTEPFTWMVGDGRPDMKAATAAGCKKVAVYYGYSQPHELTPFEPDYALGTFSDLAKLI